MEIGQRLTLCGTLLISVTWLSSVSFQDTATRELFDAGRQSRHLLLEDLDDARSTVEERAVNNTIWITSANFGFKNFASNFVCNMKRLRNENWVIGALDQRAQAFATEREWPTLPISLYADQMSSKREAMGEVGSSDYVALTRSKNIPANKLVELGFNVIFSDPDVYLNRDPTEYLLDLHQQHGYDVIVSSDRVLVDAAEMNSGFWFANHKNPMVLSMLTWIATEVPFSVFQKRIIGSGQSRMNHFGCKIEHRNKRILNRTIVQDASNEFPSLQCTVELHGGTIKWLYLNPDLFANGNAKLHSNAADVYERDPSITLKSVTQTNATVERYMVHGNWIMSQRNKKQRMKNSGMWLADDHDAVNECIR